MYISVYIDVWQQIIDRKVLAQLLTFKIYVFADLMAMIAIIDIVMQRFLFFCVLLTSGIYS